MKESDVILAPLYQSDEELKYRPAIVLREMPAPYRDLLVCGVSTRLDQNIQGFDDIISPSDADFALSGLRSESLIRLSFLAVIPRRLVRGTIGNISEERYNRLRQRLVDYLINI
ncbi:MAG: type II toxin-antitoxin system PemK/MazF family toxin [Candidatus Poribacteria bacterium]|nr:type II toxin-antitoxin system PemK/MazF family toxin [Candidatus Poribacteria bacterium]